MAFDRLEVMNSFSDDPEAEYQALLSEEEAKQTSSPSSWPSPSPNHYSQGFFSRVRAFPFRQQQQQQHAYQPFSSYDRGVDQNPPDALFHDSGSQRRELPHSCYTHTSYRSPTVIHEWPSYTVTQNSVLRPLLAITRPAMLAVIVACITVYLCGQVGYFSDTYESTISPTIGSWWGVPTALQSHQAYSPSQSLLPVQAWPNKAKDRQDPHIEMIRPTYFALVSLLPMLISVVLIEWMRHDPYPRRVASMAIMQCAKRLRRKPRLGAHWVSYWSLGECVFLLFLVGGNGVVFYWNYHRRYLRALALANVTATKIGFDAYLQMVAVTMGYNCIYNLAFLFLPATRTASWMVASNISYANGIKYHRWLGVVTVVTALLHGLGFYWRWLRNGEWQEKALPCFDCALDERRGHQIWFHVMGELALLCFLAIAVTSMPCIRRRWYNAFYYTHQLFALAVVLAVMHWAPIVWWLLPTFLLYGYSRALSAFNAVTPVTIRSLTVRGKDLVKLVIERSPHSEGQFTIGQFLYINVPSLSTWQWHAFTIASSPRASRSTLTVLVKSLGDWTIQFVDYAQDCERSKVSPIVYVDGFYGGSLAIYEQYSTVVLVGGGIGVTPMFAILQDMVARLGQQSIHQRVRQRVVFIFSFRELALLEEVHLWLAWLQAWDPTGRYVKIHLFMTRQPAAFALSKPVYHCREEELLHVRDKPLRECTKRHCPHVFYEPLRGPITRILVLLSLLVGCGFLSVWVIFGGGVIDLGRPELWLLQQFVQAIVLFAGGVFVCLVVSIERMARRWWRLDTRSRCKCDEMEERLITPKMMAVSPAGNKSEEFLQPDTSTYQDLLQHYSVILGERPQIATLIASVLEFHQQTEGFHSSKTDLGVGVFVSGPETMKRDVEHAAAALGGHHFDIHKEEFEM